MTDAQYEKRIRRGACVIEALCNATGLEWDDCAYVARELYYTPEHEHGGFKAEFMADTLEFLDMEILSYQNLTDYVHVWRDNQYYYNGGYWVNQNCAPTAAAFIRANPTGLFYIVTSVHAFVIRDGEILDYKTRTGKSRTRQRVRHAWKLQPKQNRQAA